MRNLLKQVLAVLLACTFQQSFATDYESYYRNLPVQLQKVSAPTFPDRSTCITDFGAVGDGQTLCTEAIQKAIDDMAAQGGGRVIVPQGVWLSGPITLKSNIDLHLDKNAILYFSPDKSLYIDNSPKATRVKACIGALRCTNIAITGEGIIDGNGAQWRPVKRGKVSDVEWKQFAELGGVERKEGSLWYPWDVKAGYPNIAATPEKQESMRNDLFRVNHCENILLTGVTFQNSPKFHVHPFNSRNIIIDGITVRCPWNAQNGDAIDLSDCHQALIVNSTIDAGDDGICMKSGNRKPDTDINGCQDILIESNTVYHAHGGFVIGSEDVCGMTRIVVRSLRFAGTDTGLRFKSSIGRGGKTKDIYISDIVMTDIAQDAITFSCDYENKPAGAADTKAASAPKASDKVPEFTDIHIDRITCRGTKNAITARGLKGYNCVHDITVSNSTFLYTAKGENIDTATASVKLDNVTLTKEKP